MLLIFVSQLGFCSWFETSAKENINIDEAARALVTKVCGFSIFVDLSLTVFFQCFNTYNIQYFTESGLITFCYVIF